jgi:HlyD family secretion protein
MKRKHAAILTAALLMGGGGTYAAVSLNKPSTAPKYVLAQVTKGTIVTAVSGSGQVTGLNQLDINPAVSGAITKVLVKPGDAVTKDTPLFEIDRKTAVRGLRDAQQSVHDAQLSLQSSELTYQKFVAPADPLDVVKAQNTVNQAQRDLDNLKKGADPLDIAQAQADLDTAKENSIMSADGVTPKVVYDAQTDAALQLKVLAQTLSDSLADADGVLGIDDVSKNDAFENFLSVLDSTRLPLAQASYGSAREKIRAFKADPQNLDLALAAFNAAEPMLQQTVDVLTATLPSSGLSQSALDSLKSRLQSDHTSAANGLSTVNHIRVSLDDAQTAYANAVRDVAKKQAALDKLKQGADQVDIDTAQEKLDEAKAALVELKNGPTALDIAVEKNTVDQHRSSLQSAQDRLADAQDTLNDYIVRAPFDGVIVSVPVKEAQQASASTKMATLLTKAKMVSISLNEVDIANVKQDQKATITFDALSDLSIAGTVTSVDPIGTVTQGVVTYNVQVAFVTDDDRIKPGMSANVSVATNVVTDVLNVPNGAIKNGSVQILPNEKNPTAEAQSTGIISTSAPQSVQIETGVANDQNTEVKTGLTEGEWIIVRTIVPSATTAAARTGTSLLPTGGAGGARIQGGGGNFRGGGG